MAVMICRPIVSGVVVGVWCKSPELGFSYAAGVAALLAVVKGAILRV
jgi:hypothetical protein